MGGPEPAASPRRAPVTLCPPSEPTMLGSGCTEGQRAGIEDLEAPRWRRDGDDPISSLFDTHVPWHLCTLRFRTTTGHPFSASAPFPHLFRTPFCTPFCTLLIFPHSVDL